MRLGFTLLIKNGAAYASRKWSPRHYLGHPANIVRILSDFECDEVAVHNLDPLNQETLDLLGMISKNAFMPLTYFGSIRHVSEGQVVARLGFEKVGLESEWTKNPNLVDDLGRVIGNSSVVLGITYVEDEAGRWRWDWRAKSSDSQPLNELLIRAAELAPGEVRISSASRDGERCGGDINAVKLACKTMDLPVSYQGGVASLEDAATLASAGAAAVYASTFFSIKPPFDAPLITYSKGAKL